MNDDLAHKIEEQNELLQKIYKSTEQTRRYYQYSLVVTLVLVIVPLILSIFLVPKFMSTFKIDLSQYGINY